MPLVLTACSDTSSALGKYHEGRILILNVMEMKRSDELRYSTIDTEDVVRKWRIQPSKEGQELLLMRFRIDNHVAMNTVVVADQHAAILEGFFQDDFQPISVSNTVFLDKRGQRIDSRRDALVQGFDSSVHLLAVVLGLLIFAFLLRQRLAKVRRLACFALLGSIALLYIILFIPVVDFKEEPSGEQVSSNVDVTLDDGKCTILDKLEENSIQNARLVVNAGATVEWTNRGNTDSAIQFASDVLPALGSDPLPITPGGSLSHRFDQPGTFNYQCKGGDGSPQPAQILVEAADSLRIQKDKEGIEFLEGSFNLRKSYSIDGWMIFDIPEDTEIRTLRWRAGDSITVRF